MDIIRIHPALWLFTELSSLEVSTWVRNTQIFNDTIYTHYPDWNQSTFSYHGTNYIGAEIETSPHGGMESSKPPMCFNRIKMGCFSLPIAFHNTSLEGGKFLNHEYFNYCPLIAFPETDAACHIPSHPRV